MADLNVRCFLPKRHRQPNANTKRVVQYYDSQTNDYGTKFHIDLPANNPDNKTYATNVLIGEFDLKLNTMRLNGGDPDALANDWFWDEIKTVQDAGIKNQNNSTFDTHYAVLNKTINEYGLDGIDLDIEDGENGCTDDSTNLADTLHLIKRLSANFGPDFIITLAPVSNAQFYGGSWTGLKTPAYYERRVNEGGWKSEHIVTTVFTNSDFTYPYPRSSWVGLNETGPTIETVVDKYAGFGGVGGFDYYDAQPGGYPNPWQ
ncbi:glycoside hydrolase [Xylaria sp. FL0043]|nr:glycoside hydrolase [Xylaria sp. FL0043]